MADDEKDPVNLKLDTSNLEDILEDVKKAADLKPLVEDIEQSLARINKNLEDQRKTSIKIGTGTRHETKIYIDPSKPEEAREIVETAVDMLELGQTMLEDKQAEGDE